MATPTANEWAAGELSGADAMNTLSCRWSSAWRHVHFLAAGAARRGCFVAAEVGAIEEPPRYLLAFLVDSDGERHAGSIQLTSRERLLYFRSHLPIATAAAARALSSIGAPTTGLRRVLRRLVRDQSCCAGPRASEHIEHASLERARARSALESLRWLRPLFVVTPCGGSVMLRRFATLPLLAALGARGCWHHATACRRTCANPTGDRRSATMGAPRSGVAGSVTPTTMPRRSMQSLFASASMRRRTSSFSLVSMPTTTRLCSQTQAKGRLTQHSACPQCCHHPYWSAQAEAAKKQASAWSSRSSSPDTVMSEDRRGFLKHEDGALLPRRSSEAMLARIPPAARAHIPPPRCLRTRSTCSSHENQAGRSSQHPGRSSARWLLVSRMSAPSCLPVPERPGARIVPHRRAVSSRATLRSGLC